MKKNLLSLFVLFLSFSMFAQVGNLSTVADIAPISEDKIDVPAGINIPTPYNTERALLFDNGPMITHPGGGAGGNDVSALQTNLSMNTLGAGIQQTAGNSIADNFTVTESWSIEEMHFFAYQTGSSTTSTITSVRVQIWNGAPNAGGTVIWGDLTTNVMTSTTWSSIYRTNITTMTATDRPIMRVVANLSSPINLEPGTYWIQFTMTGSLASGPWLPPVSIIGQTTTGDALQLTSTGWAPWTDTGTLTGQGAPFLLFGTAGPPCPVQPPTYTAPANGATNLPISGNTATWTNGAGTTGVEVWFGPVGDLAQVYNGAPITSLNIPQLNYNTEYGWRVVNKNDTCGVSGPTWTFTTMEDPAIVTLFFDDFESGASNWAFTNQGGTCVWEVRSITRPVTTQYTLPATAAGQILAADSDLCGTGTQMLTTATIVAPIDATIYQSVELRFDNDWRHLGTTSEAHVEVSIDGGTTWTSVWSKVGVSVRNTTEDIDISSAVAMQSFLIRLRTVMPGWHWWWAVDNFRIRGYNVIPVELVSFTSNVIGNNVSLSWATATETNNSGFEVQRKAAGSDFAPVGFVVGNGTTAEIQYYSYSDQGVVPGTYEYRLKQVDYDGTFEYSSVIEVEVGLPQTFVLEQNFPNPFNPATSIKFALPLDADVNLSIYSVLGEHIATLTNGAMAAGVHTVSFDASNLTSGVYFYRIDANTADGTNFSSVKKMILAK